MSNNQKHRSILYRWLLDNKIISTMLVILLILAIIYMLKKV
ncbi:MAG TPA: AI-2E family transporter, partial [Weissella confusa]|nr:AI-2E family transporter [Weissella confusa]